MPGTRPGMTMTVDGHARNHAAAPFSSRSAAAARLAGDLRPRQHAGDFLAAVVGGERVDAVGDALALVETHPWRSRGAGRRAPPPAAHGSPPSPAPWRRAAPAARRWRSATAPPTPVSISSNTSVGAEPRSDSTTLSAQQEGAPARRRRRLSSTGPGRVPGLVCTQNSTRIETLRPRRGGIRIDLRGELPRARASISGASSALTGLVELFRGFCPRRPTALSRRQL